MYLFFIYLWLKNKLKYFLAENLGQDYKNMLEVAKVSRIYRLAQLVEAYCTQIYLVYLVCVLIVKRYSIKYKLLY